ncbi:hypothetical protein D3C86_1630750 [compost metagenome]
MFHFRVLHQHRVGGIKCTWDIVGFGGHFIDLFFRETGGFQRFHRTGGAAASGIQLISCDGHHRTLFHIPAAFLHLFIEFLALTFTDFGGRHHHQRHGVHRLAFGVDELIVNRNHLHAVATRFRHDRRSEFWVRRTNHKSFRTAGCEAIDGV